MPEPNALGSVEVEIVGNLSPLEDSLRRARAASENFGRQLGGTHNGLDRFARDAKQASFAADGLIAGSRALREAFRDVASSIAALQGPLGPIAGRVTFLGSLFDRVGIAVGAFSVALAGLTFQSYKSVQAFAEEEQQLLTLEAVLRATGGAAGQTSESLADLATSISRTTLATDNQVRSAEAMLLTFRSVSGEEFPRALRAAQDLAATGFGSITSNAVQLGRALEDPIRGLGSLRRSGVTFTAAQREIIRTMVETGRQAEAQREVLKAIEIQVGGAGAQQAQGVTGAFHVLAEAVSDVTVKFGEWVSNTLKLPEIARGIAAGLHAIADDGDTLSYTIGGVTVNFQRFETAQMRAEKAARDHQRALKAEADALQEVGAAERRMMQGFSAGLGELPLTEEQLQNLAKTTGDAAKGVQALNQYIYDAVTAFNTWRAGVLAARAAAQEIQNNIDGANLALSQERDALLRTNDQSKIFAILTKNKIAPLSDAARAIGDATIELQKFQRALEAAGAAGVNIDSLKLKIQALRNTGISASTDEILRLVQGEARAAQEREHELRLRELREPVQSPAFQRAMAERRAELEFEREYAGRQGEAPAGELEFRKRVAGEQAYAAAIQGTTQSLRQRRLARDQDIARAEFEMTLVGKSIAEQTALRQAFEQKQAAQLEAANTGVAVSREEIAAIEATARAVGDLTQRLAVLNAMRETAFARQTMFMSPVEQGIAQQLRGIYGDDWQAHMRGALASQLRLNNSLEEAYSLSRDFAGTFIQGMREGKSAMDALSDAADNLYSRLIDMALDNVLRGLFSQLTGFLGGGGFGIGSPGYSQAFYSAGMYHTGGRVGSTPVRHRLVPADLFANAPRLHNGLRPGEFPAILEWGEGVTRKGADAGNSRPMTIVVNQYNNSSNASVKTQARETGTGVEIDVMIDNLVAAKGRDPSSQIARMLAGKGARTQPIRR